MDNYKNKNVVYLSRVNKQCPKTKANDVLTKSVPFSQHV